MKGYYPPGRPSATQAARQASILSSTLKAVLIASARPIVSSDSDTAHAKGGFGYVSLGSSLRFTTKEASLYQKNTFFFLVQSMLYETSHFHVYCFDITRRASNPLPWTVDGVQSLKVTAI